MRTNRVIQIGIVVKDIRKAATKWSKILDVPMPTLTMTFPYERTGAQYKGMPCHARMYQVGFNFDNLQVELIQPIGQIPSIWKDCLDQYGCYIHHFAFETDDINKSVARFDKEGLGVLQDGTFPGGSYAYIDSQAELGAIVELLSIDWSVMKMRDDATAEDSLFDKIAVETCEALCVDWDDYGKEQ